MDESPLRTFVVTLQNRADETVEGHIPQIIADGSLQILRYAGEIPWSVRIYASGAWQSVNGSLPTREDLKRIEEIAQREAAKQRAKEQSLTNSRMN